MGFTYNEDLLMYGDSQMAIHIVYNLVLHEA